MERHQFDERSDYWNQDGRKNDMYRSDSYETEFHVPFTEKEKEIGFAGGVVKTITFDKGGKFRNPLPRTLENIEQEEYYKIDSISHKDMSKRNERLVFQAVGAKKHEPEITVSPRNVAFEEPKGETDMVLVVKATVQDILMNMFDEQQMKWNIVNIESMERVPAEQVDEIKEPYPTEGKYPEYLSHIDTDI